MKYTENIIIIILYSALEVSILAQFLGRLITILPTSFLRMPLQITVHSWLCEHWQYCYHCERDFQLRTQQNILLSRFYSDLLRKLTALSISPSWIWGGGPRDRKWIQREGREIVRRRKWTRCHSGTFFPTSSPVVISLMYYIIS